MTRNLSLSTNCLQASLVLGALGFLSVFLDVFILTAIYFPLELIFIVWALKTLPTKGLAVVLLLSVSPHIFILTEPGHAAGTILLTSFLVVANRKLPRAPLMIAAALFWSCLWGPLNLLFPYYLAGSSLTHADLILSASSEIFIVSLASLLMPLPTISSRISSWPISLSPYSLIAYTMSLGTTFCLLLVIHLIPGDAFVYFDVLGPSSLSHVAFMSAILLTVTGLPALLAYPLALMTKRIAEHSPAGSLMPVSEPVFSGQASVYWRTRAGVEGGQVTGETVSEENTERTTWSLSAWDLANGVAVIDSDFNVRYHNDTFLELVESLHTPSAGTKIGQWDIEPEAKDLIIKLVRTALDSGKPSQSEIKLKELPDNLRFLHLSVRPYHGPAPDLSPLAIVTVSDITRRRAVESEIVRIQKLNALGAMVRNMAHSFNNTLMAISGYASFAKQAPDKDALAESLEEIVRASDRAAQNIKQLLDYIQERPAMLERMNFIELIDSKTDLIKNAAGERIEVNFQMPKRPLYAMCDGALILQAITNLIINARDSYRGSSGTVELVIDTEVLEDDVSDFYPGAAPGKYLRCRLKDDGPGMDPKTLTRSFDSFCDPVAEPSSYDLKLSTTYSIIRAHGGFMIVESRTGKGSVVSIYLPLLQTAELKVVPREIQRTNSGPEDLKGNQEAVLVVEDEESVRKLVANMLQALNYNVTACSSGEEALEHLSLRRTDLVIIDMVMPGMDGVEILKRLKDISSSPKALIMTGYGATPDAGELERPIIISKPFSIESLGQAVKSALVMKL